MAGKEEPASLQAGLDAMNPRGKEPRSASVLEKIHGATDPHDPKRGYSNDRPRDVVDIILIKGLSGDTGSPSLKSAREAVEDIFAVRTQEARAMGRIARAWPARVTAHPHWQTAFDFAAADVGLGMSMEEAVELVNGWLAVIADA